MARMVNEKCKLCKREGVKLFLKDKRCYSPKCPIEKKGAVVPGLHGTKRRRQLSEYGVQLREKQKVKRLYGVLERQFKKYFVEARKVKEATGEALLKKLESRLDNVVYKFGFTGSRSEAKQLVSHGHVRLNNHRANITSIEVKAGDVVSLTSKAMEIPYVKESLAKKDIIVPTWLKRKANIGKVERLPNRDEIEGEINEQLVVEFYSR